MIFTIYNHHSQPLLVIMKGSNKRQVESSIDSNSSNSDRLKVSKTLENKIGILDVNKIRGAFVLYSNQQYILLRESIGSILRSLGIVISNIELNRLL